MGKPRPRLVVITGPTATGKTGVAIELARMVGGEVVSADSMMVYRGMDIGTAKPTAAEMRGVPHHLIDLVRPDGDFSVAKYQDLAERAIADITGRGFLPLLVGGTGLYVRAVVDGYRFPAKGDPVLRARLVDEARRSGAAGLHARLAAVDPRAAAGLHVNDVRRVIRALEVYYLTGRPISDHHERDASRPPRYRLSMFALMIEREVLYRRIEDRVDRMVARGLVEEVAGLLARGYTTDLVSMRGLGYKETAAFVRGETDLEEAIRLLKRNTRRFAKRQLTWFRRDPRLTWINPLEFAGERATAEEIARLLQD